MTGDETLEIPADTATTERPPETVQWTVRLWLDGGDKRYAILGAAVLAAIAGWLVVHTFLAVVIGLLATLGSTTEYWLPIKYKLDRNTAAVRCGISVTSIEWSNVKRVIEEPRGVKLSPLESEGRMGAFRGVFLRFADNREEVMKAIRLFREHQNG